MFEWVGHRLETNLSDQDVVWPGDLLQPYPKVRGVLAALQK